MNSSRVLIVDDSPTMCRFLADVLEQDPNLTVVGHALDPYEARDKIKSLHPDVLTLDIEMPRMDGMTFLRNLMRLHPMPVVMISSLTASGVSLSLEAMELGAFDVIVKRHPGSGDQLSAYLNEIKNKVREASQAEVGQPRTPQRIKIESSKLLAWQQQVASARRAQSNIDRVVVVGSSTGGPQALRTLLTSCVATNNTIVIAQHIPNRFTAPLAKRLVRDSAFVVKPIRHGEALQPGTAYLVPGDQHAQFVRAGNQLYCHLNTGVSYSYTPSVDHLMTSASQILGSSAIGVVLTGMGNDGAAGMGELYRSGSLTLAQDRATSAVWGMPGAAVASGAVSGELPLQAIGEVLNRVLP